jgi:hypothetical protein
MGWFGKDKLKLDDVASEMSRIVLNRIAPDKLEPLKEWGVNPENPKHRLEILILSLFTLRSAIPHVLEQDKGVTLMLYVEHLVKVSYVDVLKLGTTSEFESTLNKRYEEYEKLDRPGSATVTPRIGLAFSSNVGIEDIALAHWAEMSFRRVRLTQVEFLRNISDKYQLVA